MLPAILLVDDDPTTNFLSTRLLNRLGVGEEIVVALNGAEALGQLQQRCHARRRLPGPGAARCEHARNGWV